MLDPRNLKDLNNKTTKEGRNSKGKESGSGGRKEGDEPQDQAACVYTIFLPFSSW